MAKGAFLRTEASKFVIHINIYIYIIYPGRPKTISFVKTIFLDFLVRV